jgi:hypothetical protein
MRKRAERAANYGRSHLVQMKTFASPSLAEAERAAADWWAQQAGLERLSEFAAPINSNRWKVTVVFVRTDLPETELEGLRWP